ncbi:hypothetical protein DV738_g5496, partial [Chaetothyriales sp. CBS 135597]
MVRALSSLVLAASALSSLVSAATRTYDFNIEWVTANPDGKLPRPVIGINGKWPIPTIEADIGDTVIVNVMNSLGNQSTSLHFHGLYMNGTSHMDGPGHVTQCPIPPGSNFTYEFTITQPGTYWYHSHVGGQYPDGLRGPLIIHDPDNPFADEIDEEIVLTLSDWYHDQMVPLIKKFMAVTNPTGAEPVPQSALMGETQNLTIPVEPGKTYFIRIINVAAFAAQYFWIEGHEMRVVEVDGIYHEPAVATQLYITASQRVGILLTTKDDASTNFAIVGSMDQDLFDIIPPGLNQNVTSYLVYDETAPLPTPAFADAFDPFDDMTLVPYDKQEILPEPDMVIQLDVAMDNLGDGANYAWFNNITYTKPIVPTLYTVLSSGDMVNDPRIYGEHTNTFLLNHMDVVEIVLNNHDPGKHPFHLHGQAFQSVYRSPENANDYNPANTTLIQVPMRRDVLLVRPQGHIVMRFRSDNPGVWLFHCHIEWHVDSGLVATFISSPAELQAQLKDKIPQDHYDACTALGMPYVGNAAGQTADLLNLEGQNSPPPPLPAGFTARGIVALVFCTIAGILGVAVVTWYGLADIGPAARAKETARIERVSKVTPLGVGVASL